MELDLTYVRGCEVNTIALQKHGSDTIRVLSVCGTCNSLQPAVAFLQTGRASILITATLIIDGINMTFLICSNWLKPFYLFLCNQKRIKTSITKNNSIPVFKYHVYSIVGVVCHSYITEKPSVFSDGWTMGRMMATLRED